VVLPLPCEHRGINLNVKAGATLAIVGKSGSGKSTMLSLLLRFYDPQQGRILIDGQPLTDIQLRSFHDQTAIVAQDTQLFGCRCVLCYEVYFVLL
jgi:ATP-binding cassette, subfamily B, bacterial